MKKGERRKRRRTLKKRSERKRVHRRPRAAGSATVLGHLRRAREYPIEGCWAMEGWDENGLAIIVIARRQPNGNIVFGTYLVDYYCLGLKNTYCNADIPPGLFHRDYLPKSFHEGPAVEMSLALAHEIIYGGIEFAAQFGFRPQSDFKYSRHILDPPDLHPRTGAIEFGRDGKPFYVQGPYDNVDAILRRLDRAASKGKTHYVAEIAGPRPDESDQESSFRWDE